jgi:hypothetical protein
LTVTNLTDTGVAGDGSLRGELAAAQPGDTITFQPGLHGSIPLGNSGLGTSLSLTRNVTIQGNLDAAGNPLVTLDGQHKLRDVWVRQGVTASFSGLSIANGYVPGMDIGEGGGILNWGNLTVQNCSITGNWAGSPVVFGYGDIGSAYGDGGGICNLGSLTVHNSTLSGNVAGGFGRGGALMNEEGLWVSPRPGLSVWKGATATVTGCTITLNTASWGGGIYESSAGGSMIIHNSTITGNTATIDAGGLYVNLVGGSTLTAPVSASATSLAVQNARYFARGETIQVDNEQLTVTGVDTVHNVLWVTRSVNHTTAAAHASGAWVIELNAYLDAFTLTHLLNNSAPSNPDIDGVFLTGP